MTIEEAARILKADDVEWNEIFDSESGLLDEALDVAIRSLEAWEKVKEEVEDKIGSLDDELKDGEVCLSYYYGKLAGLSEVLEIIDKHLAEVNE